MNKFLVSIAVFLFIGFGLGAFADTGIVDAPVNTPQVFVKEIKTTELANNIEVQIVNKDTVPHANLMVIASAIEENTSKLLQDFVYTFSTTSITVQPLATSSVTLKLEIPQVESGKKLSVQAQVYTSAGMPLGGLVGPILQSNNSAPLSKKGEGVSLRGVLDSNSKKGKEFIIDNAVFVGAGTYVETAQFNLVFVGKEVMSTASTSSVPALRNTRPKPGTVPTPTPANDKRASIPFTKKVTATVQVLDDDGGVTDALSDEYSVDPKYTTITVQVKSLKLEDGSRVRLQILDEKGLIDEKDFVVAFFPKEKDKTSARAFIGVILLIGIVLIIKFFRKKKIASSLVIMTLFIGGSILLSGNASAQGSSDNYIQTATGLSSWLINWDAIHDYFSIVNDVSGNIYNPSETISLTVTAQGSTDNWNTFAYNGHALTLKTAGNTGGSAHYCKPNFLDYSGTDLYMAPHLPKERYSTFSDTAVIGHAAPSYSTSERIDLSSDETYMVLSRCWFNNQNATVTASATPGRHKLQIESMIGGPFWHGMEYSPGDPHLATNPYAPVPFKGRYRQGELYYYVRPSAPVLSATTTPCDGNIHLSWPAVTGANWYTIYQSTSPSGVYTQVATTSSLSYNLTPSDPDTVYSYQITATHSAYNLESDRSNTTSLSANSGACTGTYPISCSVTPDPGDTNESVTWTASPTVGDDTAYTYTWSGAVTGTGYTIDSTFTTTGTKNAMVTATYPGGTKTANCSVTIQDLPEICDPDSPSCPAACGSVTEVPESTSFNSSYPGLCVDGATLVSGSVAYAGGTSNKFIWNCNADWLSSSEACEATCEGGTYYDSGSGTCEVITEDMCTNIDGVQTDPTVYQSITPSPVGVCVPPSGAINYFRLNPSASDTSCPAYWSTTFNLPAGFSASCSLPTIAPSPSGAKPLSHISGSPATYFVSPGINHTLTCTVRETSSGNIIETLSRSARCYRLGTVIER